MINAEPDLSIIIVNWNTCQLLLQTLESVYSNLPGRYSLEVIVVDNGSNDGSPQAVSAQFPQVILIANSDNRGFGPANNQGLKIAKGRYSLLLNSDVIVLPGSLEQVLDFMEARPDAGLCGIQLLNGDGTFQGSYADYLKLRSEFLILTGLGRRLINPSYPNYAPDHSQETREVDTIQGAFMFARTEAITQIGFLDEQFFMYGEENDLSLRLRRAGWKVYYLGEVKIIHLGSQSSDKSWRKMNWRLQKSKVRLFKKHYGGLYALFLKLLVSMTVFAKFLVYQLKRFSKSSERPSSIPHWFKWSELRELWSI